MTETDIIGCVGSIIILCSFWLISSKKITPQTIIYQGMMLTGSSCIVINTAVQKAWGPMALNAILGSVALFYFFKAVRTKTTSSRS